MSIPTPCIYRNTGPTARLQRCSDLGLPDHEGAVWHCAKVDDRVRRDFASPDRLRLGAAELQLSNDL